MNHLKPFPVKLIHIPALMFVIGLLVTGCSGSSDSVSSNNQQGSTDPATTVSSTDSDNNVSNEAPNIAEADAENEVANNDEPVSDLEFPDSSNPVFVDPLIQNRVVVSFDISVAEFEAAMSVICEFPHRNPIEEKPDIRRIRMNLFVCCSQAHILCTQTAPA